MEATPPVEFDNTERAFYRFSTPQLNKRFYIFLFMNNRWLNKTGKFLLNTALKLRLPVKGIIKNSVFKLFCGGETLEEMRRVTLNMQRDRLLSIPVYSIESEHSERSFNRALRQLLRMIRMTGQSASAPVCAFKPTAIAPHGILEKMQKNKALHTQDRHRMHQMRRRFDMLCREAERQGASVFIDAEESWIQHAIDHLAEEMMARYNKQRAVVYNTYQMYRKDAMKMLRSAAHKATMHQYYLGAKLVRGAYHHQERYRARYFGYKSPVFRTKDETDKAYDEGLKFCLDNMQRVYLCAGTHNEWSCYYLTVLMDKYNVHPSDKRVLFAQLYGMSDHISYNLAAAGYQVGKYLPYGPVREVMPYLMRRAEENASVGQQSSRELQLLARELRRRRKMAKEPNDVKG